MHELFVFGSDKKLGLRENNITIACADEVEQIIAIDKIDCISIFGNSQLTTQLIKKMAINKKQVHYFNASGRYLASIQSDFQSNYEKQEKQFEVFQDEDFTLGLSKKIITSKIIGEMLLLDAYNEEKELEESAIYYFNNLLVLLKDATEISQILGYEGKAPHNYFHHLGILLPKGFNFTKRSKYPPRDPINSMLSYGYSILYSYFKGSLTKYGLNLGLGFMHKTRRNHATLASDMLEEWRTIIVDDTVLDLILDGKIEFEDFIQEDDRWYLTDEARRMFVRELNNRMFEREFYFSEKKQKTFKYAIDLQIESLLRAIDEKDFNLYRTVQYKDVMSDV